MGRAECVRRAEDMTWVSKSHVIIALHVLEWGSREGPCLQGFLTKMPRNTMLNIPQRVEELAYQGLQRLGAVLHACLDLVTSELRATSILCFKLSILLQSSEVNKLLVGNNLLCCIDNKTFAHNYGRFNKNIPPAVATYCCPCI